MGMGRRQGREGEIKAGKGAVSALAVSHFAYGFDLINDVGKVKLGLDSPSGVTPNGLAFLKARSSGGWYVSPELMKLLMKLEKLGHFSKTGVGIFDSMQYKFAFH